MKSTVITLCLLLLIPCLRAQTVDEWLEQAEEATATAQTAEEEGRDVDAQNAWREAATARANAAEEQVADGEYEAAAENYEQAAEDFDKAGNAAQADSERIKAKSNYQNAADEAAAAGNSDLAEELKDKAARVFGNTGSLLDGPGAKQTMDALAQKDKKSNLALSYAARGTGQTTGHIITLSVENVGSNPVQLVATGKSGLDALAFVDEDINEASNVFGLQGKYENGLIDLACTMSFIPSDGRHQSYVATESKWPPGISQTSGIPDENGQTPITSIGPGESVVIPIHGYCADIRQPPVPSGTESSPVNSWVSPNSAVFPGLDELQEYGVQIIDAPDGGGPYLANIPGNIDPGPGQTIALSGKTDPVVTAAFLFDAIDRISVTADILQDAGLVTTPFSNSRDKERESVVQQSLWLYSSVLMNDTYTKDEFSDRMTTQYEENTGTKVKNAAPEVQERLEKGVDDFWSSFNLVGTEAKILKETGAIENTVPPEIKDELENALGKHDTSGVKTHTDGAANDAVDEMGAGGYSVDDKVVYPDKPNPQSSASEVVHVEQAGENKAGDTVDLDDVENKEDFDNWRRKKYDDYTVERELNGKSHEKACKAIGVEPDSDLGKAIKRVYKNEKS